MQIYVVQTGDTLFSIANTYETTVTVISEANHLVTPNLVVGQSLVIPIVGQYYFVKKGDTLFSIAERFDISLELLARINRILPSMTLPIGLRLYIPPQRKRPLTTFAYSDLHEETISPLFEQKTKEQLPLLTYLAPFSYEVNRDGSLTAPPIHDVQRINNHDRAKLVLVMTNIEDGAFSSELAHIILNVQAVQNKLIDTMMNIVTKEKFAVVHIDFEFIPETDREAYTKFLQKIKNRLRAHHILLSIALAPKTNSSQPGLFYEAHDFKTDGEIADFVVIMTFESIHQTENPGPISPINDVEKIVQHALTKIPKDKILMGQNLYGYDWTLPYLLTNRGTRAVNPEQAIQIAQEHHATIEYDAKAEAPYFHYVDAEKKRHIVYFEDARSIAAKLALIRQLELRGIAYWKLNDPFPQNWLLLSDQFMIRSL